MHTNPLEEVRVAAPCPADWERMVGDERVRFCDRCSLNVYNLSGMSRREAEALVAGAEGRLCVRFFRRADGTILTRNCPVGLSAIKRRAARVAGASLSALLGFFAGLGLDFGLGRAASPTIMGALAVPAPELPGPPPPAEVPPAIMGDIYQLAEQGEAEVGMTGGMGKMAPAAHRRAASAPAGRGGVRRQR